MALIEPNSDGKLTPTADSREPNVWIAFTLLSLTFFMLLVDFSIVSIALPSMESELHMTASQGQWIVSTYAIFLAGLLMLTGRCADLYGRHRFFVLGLIVFTAASFVGGMAQTGTVLIVMRALQGVGAALVNPAALAIVLSMFPPGAQRSRAIAMWGTIGSLGIAAGMLLGGILVQYLGWRAVLYVNVPIAAAILVLSAYFVPRDHTREQREQLDVLGSILLTAAMLTFVYTVESIPEAGLGSFAAIAGICVTIVLFAAFAVAERRAPQPVLPARLFRYPDLISGALVVMVQPMSYAGVLVFVSVYAQRVAGYDPLQAGLAFLPSTLLTSFVAAPLTMPIARVLGVRTTGIVMAVVMVAGESILLFMQPHSSYWTSIFLVTCIGGFGGMLVYQSGMIAGLAHVDDADEASGSAAMSFALQLGIALAVAFGAAAQELRTHALIRAGASAQVALASGLHAAFWVAVILGVGTLVVVTLGLRHAAAGTIPLRHYLPFGKLHHRVQVRS